MDTDYEVTRTRHQMKVPGLGVLIAPRSVSRLFTLHRYAQCPRLVRKPMPRILYPMLRSNVYNSPRNYRLRRTARFKRMYRP